MIRNELCAIADMLVPTFNTARNRGQLPFDLSKAEAFDGENRKWVRYSSHEAARLIAALDLAAAQGVTWSQACEILRADNIGCGDGFQRPYEVPGIHVARAEFRSKFGDAPFLWAGPFRVYEGKIEAIGAAVAADVHGYNARPNVEPVEAISLVSVNLSRAYQIAYARAEALGIALDDEGQPEADT